MVPDIPTSTDRLIQMMSSGLGRTSFREFATRYHYIRTEGTGGLQRFDPMWPGQISLDNEIEDQLETRGYALVVNDKPRRVGSTMYCSSRGHFTITGGPYREGLVIGDDDPTAMRVLENIRIINENLPEHMRPKMLPGLKGNQIVFEEPNARLRASDPGLRSYIAAYSCRSTALPRGGTRQFILVTEAGTLTHGEELWAAAGFSVRREKGVIGIIEGTGNGRVGRGRWFYQQYKAAVEGKSDWRPHFVYWPDDSRFCMEAILGRELTEDEISKVMDDLDPTEKLILETHPLKPGQIWWRRTVIAAECSGDPAKFQYEYPLTWQESFGPKGTRYISLIGLRNAKESVKPPLFEGELDAYDEENNDLKTGLLSGNIGTLLYGVNITFARKPLHEGRLRIFREPVIESDGTIVRNRYITGVDPGSGAMDTNVADEMTGSVFGEHNKSGAVMIDRLPVIYNEPIRVVLTYLYNIDTAYFASEICLFSMPYDFPTTGVEVPGPGYHVLRQLKTMGYPRIYETDYRHFGAGTQTHRPPEMGYRMDKNRKQNQYGDVAKKLRTGELDIADERLLLQLEGFDGSVLESGSSRQSEGIGCDLVSALAIALAIHEDTPLSVRFKEEREEKIERINPMLELARSLGASGPDLRPRSNRNGIPI